MGKTHVRAANDSPFIGHVVGYDPSLEQATKQQHELGVPTTCDLESILQDPLINLIYIAAPNESHCELAIKSLRAGKAVLCEKPMGTSLEESQRILAAEKETGGFLQIGFELRYSKMYRQVKDWIAEGLIGRPLNSHCDYYCSEFHLKGSWRSNSLSGLIPEKLCHYLDLTRWWFNDEVEEVHSVSAPNFVPYFNHSDNHQMIYRFKGGAVSSLAFFMGTAETFDGDPLQVDMLDQQVDDGHRLTFLIYGTKGVVETDVFRRRVRRWEFSDAADKLHSRLVETVGWSRNEEDQEWMHNVRGQNIAVSQLVAEGRPPFTPAGDSFETMKLTFAAEISESERRIVQLSEF